MEHYYSTYQDGPLKASGLSFLQHYAAKNGHLPYSTYELTTADARHPVLMFVDQLSTNEIRIDWQAFIEFKDDTLEAFLEHRGSPNAVFRVILRRVHSFSRDVADPDSKEAFEIFQPGEKFTGTVFVTKGGAVSNQLSGRLAWDMATAVVVELAWRKEGGQQWVEIHQTGLTDPRFAIGMSAPQIA